MKTHSWLVARESLLWNSSLTGLHTLINHSHQQEAAERHKDSLESRFLWSALFKTNRFSSALPDKHDVITDRRSGNKRNRTDDLKHETDSNYTELFISRTDKRRRVSRCVAHAQFVREVETKRERVIRFLKQTNKTKHFIFIQIKKGEGEYTEWWRLWPEERSASST